MRSPSRFDTVVLFFVLLSWIPTLATPVDEPRCGTLMGEVKLQEIMHLEQLHLPLADLDLIFRTLGIYPGELIAHFYYNTKVTAFASIFERLPLSCAIRFFYLLAVVTGHSGWQHCADRLQDIEPVAEDVLKKDLDALAVAPRFKPYAPQLLYAELSIEELQQARFKGAKRTVLAPELDAPYPLQQLPGSEKPKLHKRTYFDDIRINRKVYPASVLVPVNFPLSSYLFGLENRHSAASLACHGATLAITRPNEFIRFLKGQLFMYDFLQWYYEAKTQTEPKEFLDIGLVFRDEALVHSFVFVNDALVLNKDGAGAQNPLLLRPFDEVTRDWQIGHGARLQLYRNKVPDPLNR